MQRIRRSLVLVTALVAGAAAAFSVTYATARSQAPTQPSVEAARAAFLSEARAKLAGDWAGAWRSLYPFHQHIAPRRVFVQCERATPFAGTLRSLRIISARPARVEVPGQAGERPGAAVTVAIEISGYGPRDPIVLRHTFHLVPAAGRWTWLLSSERYAIYRQGSCRR